MCMGGCAITVKIKDGKTNHIKVDLIIHFTEIFKGENITQIDQNLSSNTKIVFY